MKCNVDCGECRTIHDEHTTCYEGIVLVCYTVFAVKKKFGDGENTLSDFHL